MIGKWEKVHYGDYPFLAKCSRCGHEIDTHYEGKYPNFCSNCGLPMNEEAVRRLNTVLYLCDKQNPECEKTNCGGDYCHHTSDVNHAVNFTPVVDQDSGKVIGYMEKESVETTSSEWIPITFRQADEDEYKDFIERHDYIHMPREECKVYDCRMPDDGQEVLVTTSSGRVCEDTFCADFDAYGFEYYSDPDDVIAWMPKPKAYKKGEES